VAPLLRIFVTTAEKLVCLTWTLSSPTGVPMTFLTSSTRPAPYADWSSTT
jgi:hypothetical protein